MSENEFEDLDMDEAAPTAELSEVPQADETQVVNGNYGTTYDWKNAPDSLSAPPRINLDGKEVIVNKADIIIPPADRPWGKTRDGTKDVKACTFKLYYNIEGQQEFYSGIRVFKRIVDGKEMCSHPTIMKSGKNQATKLLIAYADFKGKNPNEVNLSEFMNFLNSKPKAIIKVEQFKNPADDDKLVDKNMIEKFI